VIASTSAASAVLRKLSCGEMDPAADAACPACSACSAAAAMAGQLAANPRARERSARGDEEAPTCFIGFVHELLGSLRVIQASATAENR